MSRLLCGPMRLIKNKKKDVDEVLFSDTSTKNPNDPTSRMIVLHDFIASLKDELSVTKGEIVLILDVDRKWAYVAAGNEHERGFVPLSCLGPMSFTKLNFTETDTPDEVFETDIKLGFASIFKKDPHCRYVVLYDFTAQDENDVDVVVGECVLSLNEDDPDWTWVQKANGDEGFVPMTYLYTDDVGVDVLGSVSEDESPTYLHKLQLCGTELMSLYDYQGRISDDLTVVRGDILYADMTNQTHDEWLWAYCPRTQCCGFIPKGYARPPALEC